MRIRFFTGLLVCGGKLVSVDVDSTCADSAYADMSDAELMRLVCAGNHEAFAQIVGRHTQRYLNLAFRSLQNHGDAEDVVQQAFIRLWQKPHAWQAGQSQFTTWFYRVVLNACHDVQRARQRPGGMGMMNLMDNEALELALPAHGSEQQRLEEQQQARQRQRLVEQAFASLPMAQRDALNLVVYCGLRQQQVADILGIGLKALESTLSRARRSLKVAVAELQARQAELAQSA